MRGQTFTIAIGSEIPQLGNDFCTQVTSGAARKHVGSRDELIIAPALDGEGDQHVPASERSRLMTGETRFRLLLVVRVAFPPFRELSNPSDMPGLLPCSRTRWINLHLRQSGVDFFDSIPARLDLTQ